MAAPPFSVTPCPAERKYPMPIHAPLTPKSVLRHRPLFSDKAIQAKPSVTRASRPPQRARAQETVPPFVCVRKTTVQHKKMHLSNILVPLGSGMLVALLAVLLGQALLAWCATTWEPLKKMSLFSMVSLQSTLMNLTVGLFV